MRRLKPITKINETAIRELLFADDAVIATHTEAELQHLMDCFENVCQNFCLTISLKKTNVKVKEAEPPSIVINYHTLVVVSEFTYLGSTITSNITLDAA